MNHTIISLALIFFQLTTTALVVGFTSREHLFLRAIGSVPQGFSAYHQIVFLCSHISNPVNRAFLGAASVFLVILYVDAAILSRWTFASQSPTSSLGGLIPPTTRDTPKTQNNATTAETSASFLRKLSFGFLIALQSRFPATPWAVPRLPPFHKADPKHTPTKSAFLLKNTTKCLVYLLLLRATSGLGNPDDNPVVFASDRIPLFSRLGDKGPGGITLSEIGTRVGAVMGYWAIQYAVIDLLYSLLAVVAVSLHLTDVKGWVPVFGSVSDARGVRLFWGQFYHQLVRQGCSSIAHYITYFILRFRKDSGSLAARYVFMTLVFAVSGVFHTLSDVSQGIPLGESGAMRFFVLQAIGIMLEDGFQAIVSRRRQSGHHGRGKLERVLGSVSGPVWLVTWLTWTSPGWIYMSLQRDRGVPIIPF
uniref:Acetyltransferase fsoF n=1 Tax=Humicola fuscoatra TaxID=112175 RepID=FSOF_HUMFU